MTSQVKWSKASPPNRRQPEILRPHLQERPRPPPALQVAGARRRQERTNLSLPKKRTRGTTPRSRKRSIPKLWLLERKPQRSRTRLGAISKATHCVRRTNLKSEG